MRRSPASSALGIVGVSLAVMGMVAIVTEGIYTKEQAERGRGFYDKVCASCHGTNLEGGTSTPLAGAEFKASWGRPDLTLDDLYYIIRKTMPKDSAGSLSRAEYCDVVAYILQQNGFEPGTKELTPDSAVMKAVRFAAPPPLDSRFMYPLQRSP